MARSRKKTPCFSDYSRGRGGTKLDKRLAAKAVRNYKHKIADGKAYRKLYCSWNIHDWKWIYWEDDGSEWYKKAKRK